MMKHEKEEEINLDSSRSRLMHKRKMQEAKLNTRGTAGWRKRYVQHAGTRDTADTRGTACRHRGHSRCN